MHVLQGPGCCEAFFFLTASRSYELCLGGRPNLISQVQGVPVIKDRHFLLSKVVFLGKLSSKYPAIDDFQAIFGPRKEVYWEELQVLHQIKAFQNLQPSLTCQRRQPCIDVYITVTSGCDLIFARSSFTIHPVCAESLKAIIALRQYICGTKHCKRWSMTYLAKDNMLAIQPGRGRCGDEELHNTSRLKSSRVDLGRNQSRLSTFSPRWLSRCTSLRALHNAPVIHWC